MKSIFFIFCFILFSLLGAAQSWEELNAQLKELYNNHEYKKAIPFAEQVLIVAQKAFGKNSVNYGASLNNLGMIWRELGQYKKAEAYFLSNINILKKSLKKTDPDYINSLNNLAELYSKTEQLDNAEKLYIEINSLYKEISGATSVDYLFGLNVLAMLYVKQGLYEKAEPLFMYIKDTLAEEKGDSSSDYAIAAYDLASLYKNMHIYSKAVKLYNDADKIFKTTDQDYHLDCLHGLGDVYVSISDFEKAKLVYLETEKILRKFPGEKGEDYVENQYNLASVYSKIGEFKNAEDIYLEAIHTIEDSTGVKSIELSNGLIKLATLYETIARFEEAEQLLLKVNAIRKELHGENDAAYAEGLNNLASLYCTTGKYDEAESLLLHSNKIFLTLEGDTTGDYAISLDNLASVYQQKGNYQQAESLFLKSQRIKEKLKSLSSLSITLNNLGSLYLEMGQYEKAEKFLTTAEGTLEKATGNNTQDFFRTKLNLAVFYSTTGNYAKAEQLYNETIEKIRNLYGEKDPDLITAIERLGQMYYELGQYEKAEPLFIQTSHFIKQKFGVNYPQYVESISNLALLYKAIGEQEKMFQFYQEFFDAAKRIYKTDNPKYADMLAEEAALCASIDTSDHSIWYAKAEEYYKEAGKIYKNNFAENSPNLAYTLIGLGNLYTRMNLPERAIPLCIEGCNILKTALGERHSAYSDAVNCLADAYMGANEFNKADSLTILSNKIILQNAINDFISLSEKEKRNYILNKIWANDNNSSRIYNYKKISPALLKSNFNLQIFFKSLSLSDTRNILEAIYKTKDTAIQKLYTNWQTEKAFLSKEYSIPTGKRIKDINKKEEETENLEKELNRRSSEFRNQQLNLQIKMADIQKRLRIDEAAIEFVRFRLYEINWTGNNVRYAAYILHKNDSLPVFIPLCEENQLQRLFDSAGKTSTSMVNNLYRGIEVKNNNVLFLGDSLYKLIWAPLESYLKGIHKIAYSPAGKLYSIAFEALPTTDSGKLLIDKYQLQQYLSTRQVALRDEENKTEKPTSIVLFGNASFNMDSLQLANQKQSKKESISTNIYTPLKRGSENGTWNSLPGTAEEVKKIKQLFDENKFSTTLFTKTAASEENLKALNNNSPQIIHIATHGFFLPEPDRKKIQNGFNKDNTYTLADDPLLRSGLILSGGNHAWSGKTPLQGAEDGIVTAYEISQLNLSNTELVVLSACETALGDVKGSEGVFGLQRAFKMGGVKKLIVSLWQVPDRETAELMTTFYSYWMNGNSINDSFHKAQSEMRRKYSPFYWAAFVLVE